MKVEAECTSSMIEELLSIKAVLAQELLRTFVAVDCLCAQYQTSKQWDLMGNLQLVSLEGCTEIP